MDVPPFAKMHDFNSQEKSLSVHLPYGFSVKGRMCKIGAMGIEKHRKFGPGHGCNKECLQYTAKVNRGCSSVADSQVAEQDNEQASELKSQVKSGDLSTFQQGNTMFYRHSNEMTEVLAKAVSQSKVSRMIFEGDWHEDYRTY